MTPIPPSPQTAIAVIGNQSSGKTSVLERLSGVELPRGEGMVTRCALELRLVSAPEGAPAVALIRKGSSAGEGERVELAGVAAAVERLTDEIAPSKETISADDFISLTVKVRRAAPFARPPAPRR